MRTSFTLAVAVLAAMAGSARAEGGLTVDADQVPWPKLQARIGVASATPLVTDLWASGNPSVQGGRVLGDYYFLGHGVSFGSYRYSGAFRATSGVLLGSTGPSLSMATVPRLGWSMSGAAQPLGATGSIGQDTDGGHLLPYVGVGYTGLSTKGSWGFTADVGVLGLSSGSGLRWHSQTVDDTARELRVTPVVQLGVSYSF